MNDSFLLELKERNDIESVIGGYLSLKRSGSGTVALCPFHNEKTPSFHIFPDTQSFFCFGCSTGGDVVTFIMKMENLDYMEAIKLLADRSGLQVPENTGDSEEHRKLREKNLAMNKLAARFYNENLKSPEAAAAREYMKKRELDEKTISHFGLGYAPPGWSGLVSYLESKGFYKEDMVASGLAIQSKNKTYYDRFRDRIMFPIIDLRGNVIAFGGRVMDGSVPKYINTNDTPAFKKSNNLFALNFAKNKKSDRLILAEGYMDVIAMHKAGFTEAVATLGTAITSEQARLMARYCKEVVIAYDSDEAGQKATGKAITLLNAVGLTVRVLNITKGKDPDEYIREFGAESFGTLLDGSGTFIEYKLQKLSQKYNLSDPAQAVSFLSATADILGELRSPMEREVYVGEIAKKTGILKQTLMDAVEKKYNDRKRKLKTIDLKARTESINLKREQPGLAEKTQERILTVLFGNQNLADYIYDFIPPSLFTSDMLRGLYEMLYRRIKDNESLEFVTLSGVLDAAQMSKLTELNAIGKQIGFGDKNEILRLKDVLTVENGKLGDAEGMSDDDFKNRIRALQKAHGIVSKSEDE